MKIITRLLVSGFLILSIVQTTALAAPVAGTITVNTQTDEYLDNGSCSLREAIISANTHTPSYGCAIDGTVDNLTIQVPAGVYRLTQEVVGSELPIGKYDDLDIVTGMTITGAGPDSTFIDGDKDIDGDGDFRVFDIQAGDSALVLVTIRGLTVRNGNSWFAAGGGIRNRSNLVLENVIIRDSHAGDYGGGIYHKSDPFIPPGSPSYGKNAPDAPLAFAQLTLIDSLVTGNDAAGSGGGIANTGASRMLIEDSIISYNKSDSEPSPNGNGYGGGIFNDSSQSFRMFRSQVIGNSTGNANGGGYYANLNDDTIITDCLFSGNTTPQWGGNIYHDGLGSMDLVRSSVDSGLAHFGGGLAQMGGTLHMQNVTIANNVLEATTLGGGVYVGSADLTISFSTIAGNQAASGAGIYNDDGVIHIVDSIIAWNHTPSMTLANCEGDDLTSEGYNLSDGDSCSLSSTTHDLPDTPAGLEVYTPDHPRYPFIHSFTLLPGSAAIDAAAPDSMIEEDGRYLARGVDGDGDGIQANDIGAYEYGQFYIFLPMIGR